MLRQNLYMKLPKLNHFDMLYNTKEFMHESPYRFA